MVLGNAVFDAGIAAWDAKEYYNYVRPFTAIRYLASNGLLPEEHPYVRTNSEGVQEIYAWGGPNQNSQVDRWLRLATLPKIFPSSHLLLQSMYRDTVPLAQLVRKFLDNSPKAITLVGVITQPANRFCF